MTVSAAGIVSAAGSREQRRSGSTSSGIFPVGETESSRIEKA
jgi:hypothetical protein